MITAIKDYLKGLLTGIIDTNKVRYTRKEEGQYEDLPRALILTKDATVEKGSRKTPQTGAVAMEAWRVSQPVIVSFYGQDEATVGTWIDQFLKKLPHYVALENTAIDIAVTKLSFSDTETFLSDGYAGLVLLDFRYGVYVSKEQMIVKEVKIGTVTVK